MAAPLATCTNEEQRSVIRFLSSEGTKPNEIHQRMKVQYGEACFSLQQVYERSRKFRNSMTSVADAPRSGQAHCVVTPESIAAAEAIVMDNRRVTVNEYHQPETKRASKEWRHSSSPKVKKFRAQPSAGKVMLTLFWDE
jgi:hypothetical protein